MWAGNRPWRKWDIVSCDMELWQHKWNQKGRQPRLAPLEFPFSFHQRKFPILIPSMLELAEHSSLMPSLPARTFFFFNSSLGHPAIQGRFHRRKSKQTPWPTWELDTADLYLVECSVDFFPPALCKPFAAGYFPTCEKSLSSQQSRTYLMNGGRGLRWKQILIALIARTQEFKNDLAGLTPS